MQCCLVKVQKEYAELQRKELKIQALTYELAYSNRGYSLL